MKVGGGRRLRHDASHFIPISAPLSYRVCKNRQTSRKRNPPKSNPTIVQWQSPCWASHTLGTVHTLWCTSVVQLLWEHDRTTSQGKAKQETGRKLETENGYFWFIKFAFKLQFISKEKFHKHHFKSHRIFFHWCTPSLSGKDLDVQGLSFFVDLCRSEVTFLCCFWN